MNKTLQQHLKEEHSQGPLTEYLKEIIYGGNDGIVTTFAVVAGFSGASLFGEALVGISFLTVLLFGLANLFADGLSMGLGNYLSVKADGDVYQAAEDKERIEIRENTEMEKEETIEILQTKGFSADQAQTMTSILQTNEDYWTDWMMKHELGMEDPRGTNPILTGFATFIAFLIFGVIPLLPYMILDTDPATAFYASIGATLFALIALGIIKGKVLGQKMFRSILEVVLIGGVAAVVAFAVGVMFRA